jgi:hypothetical protein
MRDLEFQHLDLGFALVCLTGGALRLFPAVS